MGLLDKIKRDFTRHRSKAAILGVLVVVMMALTVRAVVQLQKTNAAVVAAAPAQATDAAPANEDAPASGVSAEEQINQSKELWKKLREVRGLDASVAFVFDPSLYPLDPARRIVPIPEQIQSSPGGPSAEEIEAQRRSRTDSLRDLSRQLTVKSTTVTGTGKPWAIVNNQLISVGDTVNGFEVIAIRSREVDFRKDTFKTTIRMSDDLRGQ